MAANPFQSMDRENRKLATPGKRERVSPLHQLRIGDREVKRNGGIGEPYQ